MLDAVRQTLDEVVQGTSPMLADECVFDARDMSTLPLFPFMEIAVTPLARHPPAIR